MKVLEILEQLQKVSTELEGLPEGDSSEVLRECGRVAADLMERVRDLDPEQIYSQETAQALQQMGEYLEHALRRKKEDSAGQILASLMECVRLLEQPVRSRMDDERFEIIRQRETSVQRLSMLVQFQDYYDELERRLDTMKAQEEELYQQMEEAVSSLRELEPDSAYYEEQATRAVMERRPAAPEVMDYVNRLNGASMAENQYRRHQLLRHLLTERSQELQDAIHKINMMAFGTMEILGQSSLEDLEESISLFEKSLIRQQQETKELQRITSRMDAILDEAAARISYSEDRLLQDDADAQALELKLARKRRQKQETTEKKERLEASAAEQLSVQDTPNRESEKQLWISEL